MGVIVNDNFIQVTKAHMDGYVYLKVVAIVTSAIPLAYMWKLIPTLKDTEDMQKEYAKQKEEQTELIEVQEV